LTRRAKHWQNTIIEKFGSARAEQSAAGFLFRRCNCLSEEDFRMTRIRRRIPVYQHVAQPITNEDFMAPTLADIQALARSRTETAIHVLSAIMVRETANAFARVAAAKELLDRGWGKPAQPLANDQGPLQLLTRIERVIVHPDNPPPSANRIERSELSQLTSSSREELR
jgi:hypothetical protein